MVSNSRQTKKQQRRLRSLSEVSVWCFEPNSVMTSEHVGPLAHTDACCVLLWNRNKADSGLGMHHHLLHLLYHIWSTYMQSKWIIMNNLGKAVLQPLPIPLFLQPGCQIPIVLCSKSWLQHHKPTHSEERIANSTRSLTRHFKQNTKCNI